MKSHLLTPALVVAAASSLIGVPVQETDSTPPARAHHALVYNAAHREILLVGGSTPVDGGASFKFFDDVWVYDGARWAARGASGVERSGMAVAYDSKRKRVVSFGGFCACRTEDSGRYSDLLEFKGNRWQGIGTLDDRATTDAGLVYDSRRDRLVLFGGAGGARQTLTDTREHDGVTWNTIDTPGPEPRLGFAMAYDELRGRAVLFGGSIRSPRALAGDTWVFDGRTWTRAANSGPTPRLVPGMVYDSKRQRIILFGGGSPNGALQDTWAWDGVVWSKLADDGPPARLMGALAYDAARDRVVMFGGRAGRPGGDLNDTWEWDGVRWREITFPMHRR